MMKNLTFRNVPRQLGACRGHYESNGSGGIIHLEISPGGGTESKLSSGTDVVLVLDASFSMFVRAYRNARVIELVDKMVKFMTPYDDDGIDVYLHSLRNAPFRHLGAHAKPDKVIEQLGEFMEARTAASVMGQRTVCAPVIHDIVKRLKEEKGSDRVFIEIVTDGEFNDETAVEEAIIEYGEKYNSIENPFGIRFHFTGIGPDGAKGLAFLDRLDNKLQEENPGFIDCVQHSHAETVEKNIETIIGELQQTVRLNADNPLLEIAATGADVHHVLDVSKNEWNPADTRDGQWVGVLSWEGGLPVQIRAQVSLSGEPSEVSFSLQYQDAEADNPVELRFQAGTG